MVRQRVRQVEGDAVVTIPAEDLARLGIAVGDLVAFEPTKIAGGDPDVLPPEVAAIAERYERDPTFRAALDYLRER